jgi:hypothetical protein
MTAAALAMVLLHRADGGVVAVVPSQITALHAKAPPPHTNKVSPPEAHCVLWLADGKILSVLEPCDTVRSLLETAK